MEPSFVSQRCISECNATSLRDSAVNGLSEGDSEEKAQSTLHPFLRDSSQLHDAMQVWDVCFNKSGSQLASVSDDKSIAFYTFAA